MNEHEFVHPGGKAAMDEVMAKARKAMQQHPELSMREIAETVIIPGLGLESSRVKRAILMYADKIEAMRMKEEHKNEEVNTSESKDA